MACGSRGREPSESERESGITLEGLYWKEGERDADEAASGADETRKMVDGNFERNGSAEFN